MAELFRNQAAGGTVLVALDAIDDNPYQPRQIYNPAALEELATSIESEGLLQAPAGRRMADGRVQLIFGHRRRRAFDVLRAKDAARWSSMPVLLVEARDEDMAARAWAENVERQDLTAVEQAQAMQRMMESFGWTQADVGRRLGMAPATVANKLRLLRAPVEVQEAVATGRLSERQAGAMAPVWDLPAPALEAARNRQGYGGIEEMVDMARRGSSSDDLRQAAKVVVDVQTWWLDGKAWTDVELGHVARVMASRCTLCQYRILSAGAPRCAGQRTCYDAKENAWVDMQRATLAEAVGVPGLPSATAYNNYKTFFGDDLAMARQAEMNRQPLCKRLRVLPARGGGLRLDGNDQAELVCLHGGRGCECLERLKRQVAKDDKAAWRLMRQQTVDALADALQYPSESTLRLWASMYAPMDQADQVVMWRMEDVVKTIIKALMDRAKPYDAESKPEQAREAMEKLLRRGDIAAPWSLAAALAPEPDPVQRMRGRVQLLAMWIREETGETPIATDVARWCDNSREAMDELAGLPAGVERDDLAALADAVNQSALEMLALVAAGYRVSKDVAWICHTPVSDVNARTSLERATVDDLRWCLAVARCQPEGKMRREAIQRRLKQARSAPPGGSAQTGPSVAAALGMTGGRPFPSTASMQAEKRERLHRPNGYIAPTVDPNAPDHIDAKLRRIAGWIAEFVDPGDGLPTPESVAGNFDNLDKLAQRIAGRPSDADQAKLQAMHAQVYADLAALSDRVQASYGDEEISHA